MTAKPETPPLETPAAAEPSTAIDRAPSSRVAVVMGVAPQSIDEAWRLAQMLAKAGDLVPKAYRDNPPAIMAAMQFGMEVGLAPMQALQSIAVIGGRPALWGDGLLALVLSSPLCLEHDEYFEVATAGGVMARRDRLTAADLKVDTTAAVCLFARRDTPQPVVRIFSVGQARKANLIGEGNRSGKEGPWASYPDRMLVMRARSWAARDAFPDVLRGLTTVEELRDLPADDADRPRVRRRSEPSDPPPPADDAAPTLGPMPGVDLSHYCDWDAPGGDLVRALCGVLMSRREHTNAPACADCLAALARRETIGEP